MNDEYKVAMRMNDEYKDVWRMNDEYKDVWRMYDEYVKMNRLLKDEYVDELINEWWMMNNWIHSMLIYHNIKYQKEKYLIWICQLYLTH